MKYGLVTKLAVAGMSLMALGVAGCGERVVYRDAPPPGGAVVEEDTVIEAPPEPQYEVIGVAPWPG